MYLTFDLARYLNDAPWPATKHELIDYAERSGAPQELLDSLNEIEETGEEYYDISDLWDGYDDGELYSISDDDN